MTSDLRLRLDKTFECHVVSRVMSKADQTVKGKYRIEGTTLYLTGASRAHLEDGNRKRTQDSKVNWTFQIGKGELTKLNNQSGVGEIFRRKGSGPPKGNLLKAG